MRIDTSGRKEIDTVAVEPTPTQLARASAYYVSGAQLSVKKGGVFNARVARENPDVATKLEAAKEMAANYRKGASLYRSSAEIEDRRAEALAKEGKLTEARAAREKAEHTREVAARIDRQAGEIETKGVPGDLPSEISIDTSGTGTKS